MKWIAAFLRAFIPLEFDPGEALQIDWGEAFAYIRGSRECVHLFCARLCYRNYLSGTEFGRPEHAGHHIRSEVSNPEIWCECFGRNLQELKPSDSYGIAAMMAQVPGWVRTSVIRRQPIYGRQRVYQRTM